MLTRVKICLGVIIGKSFSYISRVLSLGDGSTWAGHLALFFYPGILTHFTSQVKKDVILIAGTNGKTTTSSMIRTVLEAEGKKVIHNQSGANLLNGVVSAYLLKANLWGDINADYAIFEVDEATLPVVISTLEENSSSNNKLIVVLLNLFRDQLDRYGEVDTIARKWHEVISKLGSDSTLILNADDPQIAYLGKNLKLKITYFGLNNPKLFLKNKDHATDSIFCLNCGNRLSYSGVYYSHLGIWNCDKCGEKRPMVQFYECKSPLPGIYNLYNTLAAIITAKGLDFSDNTIKKNLSSFSAAFGRQEEFLINGKKIKIFLSKNPVGFNESLRTVISLGAKEILFVLNDRIPDGRDVSWIWDVDFEMLPDNIKPIISGDRVYDMALRIKYASKNNLIVEDNLEKAIKVGLEKIKSNDTLYILPTYSAMLEVRKILIGKKIL